MTSETDAAVGPEVSVVTPLDVPGQPRLDLDRALEALLFVADEPQSLVHLAAAVARPIAEVKAAIARLRADYDGGAPSGEPRTDAGGQAAAAGGIRRAFELREVGGGWRFYAREEYDALITSAVLAQTSTRLSQPALETLAVIAYKQPISRSSIASIRAVNVDSVVRTLLGRGLITEVDTDEETGAILYGTTDLLLTNLGIASLDDLPPISPLLDGGQEGFERDHL
ncbi:segregation and condensation protein B [Agromyces flavus]|uniref:Segregation and condensation protein B n=1 Tax=Agromyces flavus TaxID=589382 RepID=A0A1H1SR80_9MICO|nr:SMC-Scp complex subunit ScpB [Agromyces flavus]MCP2369313.1 segregation and condensation protein B [Agromyces flavus]GGI48526.1 segregation and condensation protein B [Agromyces flavus]SDS50494.1 segregation and condensation protein B [Agromyces flavus]